MGLIVRPDPARRDEGTVFVFMLVLIVVTAMVVVALASYAAVGLRTSRATAERTNSTGDVQAAVAFVAEQMAQGEVPCEAVAPPGVYVPNLSAVSVTCQEIETLAGEPESPVVRVRAESGRVWVEAYLQVVPYVIDDETGRHPVVVYSWSEPA